MRLSQHRKKIYGLCLISFIISFTYQGCGKKFQNMNFSSYGKLGDPQVDPPIDPPLPQPYGDPYNISEGTLASLYPADSTNISAGESLFTTNCSLCHNNTAKRDREYSVYRQVIGLNSTINPMKGIDLVSADVYKIYLYLTTTVDGVSTSMEQSQPLLGTRTYIASVLENIFISELGTLPEDDIIQNKITSLILNQPGAIGGACQKNDATTDDPTCKTKISETTGGSMLPASNAIRRGYVNRACDEILSIAQSVSNALEKIDLSTTSNLTTVNISSVYDLFTPGRPMPTAAQTALMNVANNPQLTTNTEKWRFVLYAVCRSIGVESL